MVVLACAGGGAWAINKGDRSLKMSLSTMNKPRGGGGGVAVKRKIIEDKYSIKSLIFLHPTSTYEIPVDIEGHKVFFCVDCGDKFVCESSYNYHVNRRSAKITYTCRVCSKTMVYMNRCNLLSHIRSHVFKTATINLVDLKIEPLPIEDMLFGLFHLNQPLTMDQVLKNEQVRRPKTESNSPICIDHEETIPWLDSSKKKVTATNVPVKTSEKRKRGLRTFKCSECNCSFSIRGSVSATRRNHFITSKFMELSCPICSYKLQTMCAWKAHLKMHQMLGMNCVCPECGEYVRSTHFCEGSKAVKKAIYVICPAEGCGPVQMQTFLQHYKQEHIKAVYKCSMCISACFTAAAIKSHIANKHPERADCVAEVMLYYQCMCCPGRLVLKQCLNSHIQSHKTSLPYVNLCINCGMPCDSITSLLDHIKDCKESKKTRILDGSQDKQPNVSDDRLSGDEAFSASIQCPMCDQKLSSDWDNIKKHLALYHKKHRGVDVRLELQRVDSAVESVSNRIKSRERKKRSRCLDSKEKAKGNRCHKNIVHSVKTELKLSEIKKKITLNSENKYKCLKCGDTASSTQKCFEEHILTHRDPSTAYQCMECGFCFVVKPSFSTHLFVAHGIKDAEEYIKTNKCYNEDAFKIVRDDDFTPKEPLKENQCKICREEFDDEENLRKHFRVHGMAFILTAKRKK